MNIISQKYDAALDYHVTMYDNLPYQRDAEYCNAEKIALYSGKVIKYYLCVNQTEKRFIDNQDDQMEQRLKMITAEKKRSSVKRKPEVITDSEEVTQEQIQTLLDDKGNPIEKKSSAEETELDSVNAAEDAVNAFNNVEDW